MITEMEKVWEQSRQKLGLLQPNLRSDKSPFLQYPIGYRDQFRYNACGRTGQVCEFQEVGIIGAIMETGYQNDIMTIN